MRSAATMGGNLALAKQQGLESDAATLLAALSAKIAVVSIHAEEPRWTTAQLSQLQKPLDTCTRSTLSSMLWNM